MMQALVRTNYGGNHFVCRNLLLILCLMVVIPLISAFHINELEQTKEARCPLQHEIDPCSCRQATVLEFTCHNINIKRLLDVLEILRKESDSIHTLTILDSNLINIPRGTFKGLQIEELIILNSNVSTIEDSAFADLRESLKKLVLARNRIIEIPTDSFSQLHALKVLDLSRNKIEQLEDSSFSGLGSLEELLLQNNDIATVDQYAFEECCGDLLVLNLASNLLPTIPTEAFEPLANMSYLKLNDNNIKNINKKALHGLTELNTLDLSNNFISVIEDNAFDSSSIHSLVLKRNSIKKVPEFAFAGLDNTTEWLDLSYNEFINVPAPALATLRALRHLDLSHNRITELQEGTFSTFGENLRYLELNNNNLQDISPKAFLDLPMVEFLMLNKNNLTQVSKVTVEPTFDTIFILDMSENPLVCGCELKWLKDWFVSVNPLDRLASEPTCLIPEDGQMLYIGQLECSNEDESASASSERMCTDLDCVKSLATFFSKRTWWY